MEASAAMDILRLMILMGLLIYGVLATDRAREVINVQRQSVIGYRGLTQKDKVYLKQVASLASVHPASIVVQDGVLLGTGHDRVTETLDPTAHAETEAIRDACRRTKKIVLNGGILYSARQPCTMCMRVISNAGITKVIVGSESAGLARSIIVPEFVH